MAVTTTSTLTAAMQTHYDNLFLSHYQDTAIVMAQGQKRPIPRNSGKTIDFFRYHPYNRVTSAGTEGTVGTEVATRAINTTATMAVWKNYTKVSEFLRLTSRDRNLENIVELMGQNAAESQDWETQKQIALYGATYIRSDVNNTYQFEMTCGSDVSNASTTQAASAVIDAYCATNDHLIGSVITFRKGFGYGQSRVVTDFTATAGVLAWTTELDETLRQGAVDTGVDVITAWFCEFKGEELRHHAALRQGFQSRAVYKAVEMLEAAGAPKFSDGTYHGLIDPMCKRQLMAETDVQNYMTRQRPTKIEKWMIGEFAGVNWYLNTAPRTLAHSLYTVPTESTFFNDAGKFHITWVFGKNAFGIVQLDNRSRKIIVKTPGPNTVSTPTDEYGTVGWKAYWIAKALNANYAVAIVSYQAQS